MKKRKICVVTGSRAEYGLLAGLMKEISADSALELQVVVSGMHLEARFGMTVNQIISDGFKIAARVPMRLTADTDPVITAAAGRGVAGFARAFDRLSPDIVVVLGDRFETLAAATATTLMRLPLAHIHGGEVTEGAYDDIIRHAVSKMAHLHFATHAEHARRIVQMGESPERVFNVGAPGLDNIRQLPLLTREALEKELSFKIGDHTALVTFHPVTMQKGAAGRQVQILLAALEKAGLRYLFTMPNADPENQIIRLKIRSFVKSRSDAKAVESLGSLRYLSLMKYAAVMVGNSSSGIIEAPSFQLPVVNIGDRQKGRLRAANVIDVPDDAKKILQAILQAASSRFRKSLSTLKNPYGDGHTAPRIRDILKTVSIEGLTMKPFVTLHRGQHA
ncbi:MAG: UDP-N-acetylglucosamine 2-epimerase (hydrolyzing) [Candidatus Omnitrophica bacterium]|nr:UDP-N-acetylglucosamine 2-epimerase (hydrolyzing) [Candidatus Omnitrophota bacterium]